MSEQSRFRPFGSTDGEYGDLLELRDGVPTALKEPLLQWLFDMLAIPNEWTPGHYLNAPLAHTLLGLTRIDLGQKANGRVDGEFLMNQLRRLDDALLLRLTDALLYLSDAAAFDEVEPLLARASSRWTVGVDDDHLRLQERLPIGVLDQIEAAVAGSSSAGALLHKAFTSAYGLNPDAGQSYKMAVKAVETAAHKIVEPRNTGATLGTMLAVMRQSNQPWIIPLVERADHVGNNGKLLIAMLQSIWDGQEDRHRDGAVGLEEARAAFHIACTVVAWFSESLVQRVEN
jgi:hypothetical protein